jgi:hypothetical protein
MVLILTQDRCTVCAERTIGSENIFDASDGLLGDVGHVESWFGPLETELASVQDHMVGVKHTIWL